MSRAHASLLALAMLVTGCGSVSTQSAEPGPIAFESDPTPSEGATVFVDGGATLSGQLAVAVMARGAKELHGAAFRITYDPDALGYVDATPGPAWSKTSLAIVKEATPGQLLVTWSEKGEAAIDATSDTVLGHLTFAVKGRKASTLAFKVERSQLVDKRGMKLGATWRGGTLAAR